MKLTEYLKKEVPKLDDLLLIDGADGTNVITFEKLAKALKSLNEISSINQFWDWLDEVIPMDVRCTFIRGKNLGNALTKEQAKNIVNGSFKGFFIGDYWVGKSADDVNVSYQIADINYWYRKGQFGSDCRKPHLVLFPNRYNLISEGTSQTTNDGYLGSSMHEFLHSEMPKLLASMLKEDDVLSFQENLSNKAVNGVATSSIFVDNVKYVLPTMSMLVGGYSGNRYDCGFDVQPLRLLTNGGYTYMRDSNFNVVPTRDITSVNTLLCLLSNGVVSDFALAFRNTVRSVFGITGEATAS